MVGPRPAMPRSRPYIRPSQSSGVRGIGPVASRRRSRKAQRQQPPRPKRRRQRRHQAKRKRRGADAGDDRQCGIVELLSVIAHLVGRREERNEVPAIAVNMAVCHGWAIRAPAGTRTRPIARLKAAKVTKPGQHGKGNDRCKDGGNAGADHETHSRSVSLIGARREQNDNDRGKGHGIGAVRPCGHDPEQCNGDDGDKRAACIDQSRKPIGHAEPDPATAYDRSSGIGDKQSQPVEDMRNAGQHLSGLVRQQTQRWHAGGQSDQPARTAASQTRRRPTGSAIQRPARPAPGAIAAVAARFAGRRPPPAEPLDADRPSQAHRHCAPAGQSGEQSVHRSLQHRRVIAQLGRLAERLVDDRVEGDDAPHELAPNLLRLRTDSDPANANVPVNRPVISAARAANNVASRRRAPPKSVPARTTPAQTMPMQISLTRVTASMKACPFGPPVAPSWSLAMIAAVTAGQCRAHRPAKLRSNVARRAHPAPHSARPTRNGARSCGKKAVSTTIATPPTMVPIRRNHPLRSEAPRCG